MKLPFVSALLLAALSALAGAGVIYEQPAAPGATAYQSARTGAGGSNSDEFVWDGFVPATAQVVREIQWQGVRSGTTPTGFEVSLNTIALPGGTVWNITGNANETATGTPGVYTYRFTLPAGFPLTGAQGYWLRILAIQNGAADWSWSAGTGGNNSHLAQVPAVTGDYRYVNWTGDCAFQIRDAATVPVTITLAKSPSAGGTVTGGGTFAPGAAVTVTATAAVGRTFLNWTEAGTVVSTSASFTFPADGTKTLTANFSGPNTGPYVISAVANPSVYGNVGGAGTYQAGEVVDLDVTAADGLSFVGWTENGEIVNLPFSDGVFQVTASADRHLVANFAYLAYTSFIHGTVAPASSGTVTIGGTSGMSNGSYYGGTMITLTATPYAGYHFASWKQGAGLGDVSGAPHIVGTTPTLRHLVCYATTITANFEPDFPVLTLSASPAGAGVLSGAASYAHGSNVTANAQPAVGYVFSSWKKGTTVVSTSPSYTFPITSHTALTAVFTPMNRTITATALPAGGGTVTGAGVVGNGAAVTLEAVPQEGYVFSQWTLNGAAAGSQNPVSFEALGDYAFVANFLPLPALTLRPSAPGFITLGWPAPAAGWVLQESTTLEPSGWQPAATQPSSGQPDWLVTLPATPQRKFFRLVHP